MNTILLITTTILAFSGFIISFYGSLSQSMIERETKIGFEKGINSFTDQGDEYFARKYEKWKAGNFFLSNSAIYSGIVIVIIALILNLLKNPWWTTFIVLIIGYYLYLFFAKIIGWKIQLISFVLVIISFCYSLFLVF